MKKLSVAVCTLALLSALDAVGGAPTPTPAASATPKAAKAGSAKGIKQMTLVEVTGPGSGSGSGGEGSARSDPEIERFMSAFLFQMSEKGFGNIADARLSGGKLDDLRGPAGDEFRKAWPAEGYLGVKAEHCDIESYQTVLPDQPRLENGQMIRTNIVIQGYRVSCPVAVTLIGAADGKVLAEIRVTGQTGEKLSTEDTEAEGIASEDAAKKAAKKLVAALK